MNDPLPLFGITTTPLELVSFLLALVTVALNIRQNPWAWFFAIVSSALYAVVFYGARLYGDMSLQAVFIVVSFWGWYQWLRGGDEHQGIKVSRLRLAGKVLSVVAWLLSFLLIAVVLNNYTDTDVAYSDGFLTAGSLVGQVLLARKKLESWYVWIAVDVLYIGLYWYKDLLLTAVLYGVFVAMAIMGLLAWKKSMQQDTDLRSTLAGTA